jgi:hypothetical protein
MPSPPIVFRLHVRTQSDFVLPRPREKVPIDRIGGWTNGRHYRTFIDARQMGEHPAGRLAMTAGARDFHLEEYKHLKQQISSLIDKVVTIVQYVLGGVAAVYAWLITNQATHSEGMASIISA